jgi:hypothetical protein
MLSWLGLLSDHIAFLLKNLEIMKDKVLDRYIIIEDRESW